MSETTAEETTAEETLRVRRVMNLIRAEKGTAARFIGNAVDDTYEKMARDLLRSTNEKRVRYGFTETQQEEQTAHYMLLSTAEWLLAAAKGRAEHKRQTGR